MMFLAQLFAIPTPILISLCTFLMLPTLLATLNPSRFIQASKLAMEFAPVAADWVPTLFIAFIALAAFLATFSISLTWLSMLLGHTPDSSFPYLHLAPSAFTRHYLDIAMFNTRIGDGFYTFTLFMSLIALSLALLVVLVHERRQTAKELYFQAVKRVEFEKATVEGRKTVERCNKQLADVDDSLSCLICVDRLTQPYTLAPCGHTFDLECLQSWFRAAHPREGEEEFARVLNPRGAFFALRRTKVCPLCHTKVRGAPAPARALRGILKIEDRGEERNPWKGLFVERFGVSRAPPPVVLY
ncbi:hypothetical protein FB45DRAFT_1135651 [Roridomyces roridus]|uniref:RING-type domain-containing protein n=1 Tax=Roridomyces roridus TaxID=1738132 RepID=A0AAD7B0P9_9AGAR|nr:hypothetical protein FB45DRAFT_1135651 [Roridomyces roridus]